MIKIHLIIDRRKHLSCLRNTKARCHG